MSSVSGEQEKDYEERIRQSLPTMIFEIFGVRAIEPRDGFCRKFLTADFELRGPLWRSTSIDMPIEVECDFFYHASAIDDTRLPLEAQHHFSKITTSPIVTHAKRPSSSVSVLPGFDLSPEKATLPENESPIAVMYGMAEITQGGKKTVLNKVVQLEKDCWVAMSKVAQSDDDRHEHSVPRSVLDVVALIMIVNPKNLADHVFNHINSNQDKYPYVHELFEAGRFAYIQNTSTLTNIVRHIESQLASLPEDLTAISAQMESQLTQLTSSQEAISAQMESQLTALREEMSGLKLTLASIMALLQNRS